ncbi:hypothetical protein ERJ75_000898900 [Trypanosoma vivax]|nr:hypothetical protein ERJ75_000898900 [Trypanosoma vivax]
MAENVRGSEDVRREAERASLGTGEVCKWSLVRVKRAAAWRRHCFGVRGGGIDSGGKEWSEAFASREAGEQAEAGWGGAGSLGSAARWVSCGIVPSAVCAGFLGFVGTGMAGWVGRLGGQCRGEVKREGRRAPGAGEMRGKEGGWCEKVWGRQHWQVGCLK